jgi:hypothetical protein
LWTNYVTTAANATEQQFQFTSEDDFRDRYIETIFVGLATAGVQLGLYTSGQEYSTIDLTRFAAGDAVLYVDFVVKARLYLTVSIKDLAGAAHTNIPIVIGYRVDPAVGP